jgi:hypothetical protein
VAAAAKSVRLGRDGGETTTDPEIYIDHPRTGLPMRTVPTTTEAVGPG